jgi:hypothetical protein
LKESKIKTSKRVPDVEDFINTDDDLATSGVPTCDDIIDKVLQKEGSKQDSYDYIKETTHETISGLFVSPGCCANISELFWK